MNRWFHIAAGLHLVLAIATAGGAGEGPKPSNTTCHGGVAAEGVARARTVNDIIEAAIRMSNRNGEDTLDERVAAVRAKFLNVRTIRAMELNRGEATILAGIDPSTGKQVVIKLGVRNRNAAIDAELTRYVRDRFIALHPGKPIPFLDARYSVEDQAMIMEVANCTLDDWIQSGPKPFEERLRIVSEIFAAVEFINAQNVIHHDIKPGNVMLMADGRVVVTDFGLSSQLGSYRYGDDGKFTRGTLAYMNLGHVGGRKPSRDMDAYATRLTAIEVLLGKGLHESDSAATSFREYPSNVPQVYPIWASSPHTIDPQVHPALSAALHFPARNMRELSFLFNEAREYIEAGNGDGFFEDVFAFRFAGLAQHSPRAAANMLLSSKEIMDAYERGLLPLNGEQHQKLWPACLQIYEYYELPEQTADITVVPPIGTPLRPVRADFRQRVVRELQAPTSFAATSLNGAATAPSTLWGRIGSLLEPLLGAWP